MTFILNPGHLSLDDLNQLIAIPTKITLATSAIPAISAAHATVNNLIQTGKALYGINTGFGGLANTKIANHDLNELQKKIVLSHAAGIGECLPDSTVRLMLLLKINSLARGYSGVALTTINALCALYNANLYPCIPAQGSVGASGDLSPLAHLAAVLLGYGKVSANGEIINATEALQRIGLQPLVLGPKEGLALLNGTQASTALALEALHNTYSVFKTALVTGAMSTDAARGSDTPFDARIHLVRGHQGQIEVANLLRALLAESEIRASHKNCNKVQDPYSLRCQPQVMGAVLHSIKVASEILLTEANAVSDNPLIFSDDECILSGGNFHAEPVGFAADMLAVAIAEIGAIAERRIALLVDPHFSGLPAFLVPNPGMNSGFMSVQVTAAALASENKSLAHPASVDSLPTSANQEDHVSMATYAARRLGVMLQNVMGILAIELLAAAQGIDFLAPLKTSPRLLPIHALIRSKVPFYQEDRYFANDIEAALTLVKTAAISTLAYFRL